MGEALHCRSSFGEGLESFGVVAPVHASDAESFAIEDGVEWQVGLLAGVDGVGDVAGRHGVRDAADAQHERCVSGSVVDDPPPVLVAVAEHDQVAWLDARRLRLRLGRPLSWSKVVERSSP